MGRWSRRIPVDTTAQLFFRQRRGLSEARASPPSHGQADNSPPVGTIVSNGAFRHKGCDVEICPRGRRADLALAEDDPAVGDPQATGVDDCRRLDVGRRSRPESCRGRSVGFAHRGHIVPRRRAQAGPPGGGIAPSCIKRPAASICDQCSTSFPSAMRWIAIPSIFTSFPVGGIPRNSPVCLP